jgi:hypothetical protein
MSACDWNPVSWRIVAIQRCHERFSGPISGADTVAAIALRSFS